MATFGIYSEKFWQEKLTAKKKTTSYEEICFYGKTTGNKIKKIIHIDSAENLATLKESRKDFFKKYSDAKVYEIKKILRKAA